MFRPPRRPSRPFSLAYPIFSGFPANVQPSLLTARSAPSAFLKMACAYHWFPPLSLLPFFKFLIGPHSLRSSSSSASVASSGMPPIQILRDPSDRDEAASSPDAAGTNALPIEFPAGAV